MKISMEKLRTLIKEEMEVMFRPGHNDDDVYEKGDSITIDEEEFYILESKVYETEESEMTTLAVKRPDGRYTYRVIMKEDGSFTPLVPTHTVQGWLV